MKMTYENLAEASGLSRTACVNLETGVRNGSINAWFALSKALDVPFAELMATLDTTD